MVIRKSRKKISLIILAVTCFATLFHHFYNYSLQSPPPSLLFLSPPSPPPPQPPTPHSLSPPLTFVLQTTLTLQNSPPLPPQPPPTVAVLIPDWEVLIIVPPESTTITEPFNDNYLCIYPDKSSPPAKFSGKLPFNGGYAFKCILPPRNRRRLPFFQPTLVRTEEREIHVNNAPPLKHLLRWNFIVYDSFTTENDVVLFVKGVNNRQGINRQPSDFRCVFYGDDFLTAVRTPVMSSVQEVFRCLRPEITGSRPINVSIEILEVDRRVTVIPTLAKYVPDNERTIVQVEEKSLLCACTMVYNVGKFLKEWVMFHSKIGVERFILYDNDSDDDLEAQVESLRNQGYDVRVVYWAWPKAQEAGFSHCSLYAARICDWVAFVDVDEFFLSPTWIDSESPTLASLLPPNPEAEQIGQVSIRCNEFGPSNQTVHPDDGVTQGYTCRRRMDQRHKSIVYLPVVDHSLLNVVHHFKLIDDYRSLEIGVGQAIVNHYKYQAWPEFRAKFRRRVSAYVIDWRQNLNPMSNDRAPGLGFEPIEPPGWAQRFCEVRDERMKMLTRKWFGVNESTMAWQSYK